MSSSSACPHLAVQKVPLPNLTSEKVLQIPPKESLRDGVESPDGKRVLAEFEFGPVCGLELDRRCRHLAGGGELWSCRHQPPARGSSRQPAAAGGAGAGKVKIFFSFGKKI